MTQTDQNLAEITVAVELGRSGDRAGARTRLAELWDQVSSNGDPLLLVTCSHYLADLQDDVQQELKWDERALSAIVDLTDEQVQKHSSATQVRGCLPSLHLNLADCHRRLGDPKRAREHLAKADRSMDALADDDYGHMMHAALQHVHDALEAGSTDPLPTAP